jgi:4-diphosphocytidyl-2-C-methyl-D-erythritol kinase
VSIVQFHGGAPAKINLSLRVVGRRSDGKHLLSMLTTGISLYDELSISVTSLAGRSSGDRRVEIFLEESGESADPSLVTAATALFESIVVFFESFFNVKLSNKRFCCRLRKRIPSGAGLGGGSSDAALFLLFLKKYLLPVPVDITQHELSEVATRLGADIPFFLKRDHALVEGIGEYIRPIQKVLPAESFFLVFPHVHVSTKTVFDECRRALSVFPTSCSEPVGLFNPEVPLSWEFLREMVQNDLLAYACIQSEKLGRCYERLQNLRRGYVTMSGSGSTLVVFPTSARCSTWLLLEELQTAVKEEYVTVYPVRFLQGWHQKE